MRLVLFIGLCLSCGALAFAQLTPLNQTITVTIHAGDDPMRLDAVEGLLATDGADRLALRPATLADADYRQLLLTGQYEKLAGFWPFRPPGGDPAKITKADYLALLRQYPGEQYYLTRFCKTPAQPDASAYEAVPVFVALYKATGEQKYLGYTRQAIESMCLFIEDEVKKNPDAPASYAQYWVFSYAFIYLPLREIADTPDYAPMMARFTEALAKRADAWPTQTKPWPCGAHLYSALWYELALRQQPPMAHAADIKAYLDALWQCWWDYRDVNEDDPNYTLGDMVALHAWCTARGVEWWKDPEAVLLWRHFAEQIGNDGSWPAYGDGGNLGRFGEATFIGELLARYTRDGRYKWLAHRAFWNTKERLPLLCANIGYEHVMYLAMAYLTADDTLAETPVQAGVTVTHRHWREFIPSAARRASGVVFAMKPERIPGAVVFRGGPKETDCYLTLQAGQHGGHGHPDSTAISGYGGDFAYYLTVASHRMDHFLEAHNLFSLREPPYDRPWGKYWYGLESTEAVSVPVSGSSAIAGYARVHVQEYPDNPATPARWDEVRNYKSIFPPEKAIGYKNWPMRLDRGVLFVNNHFVVVRDVTNWVLPATAQMGQNWNFGELGGIGANWVNGWAPKFLSGHFDYNTTVNGRVVKLAPVESAPRDLLIWFAPRPDGALVLEKLTGDRSGLENYAKLKDINLRLRAWYTATGDWPANSAQAFTTVLLPHAPGLDAAKLAATITAVQDSAACTILRVTDGDTVYLAILNSDGKPVTAGPVTTDAEAALFTTVKGKPAAFAAWQATQATVAGKKLRNAKTAGDVEFAWK